MSTGFGSLCDDFYIDMYINTRLELSVERDMLLAFFERIQRSFPAMCNVCNDESDEFVLEEDRESGQYRWVTIEPDRVGAGFTNPPAVEDAVALHKLVIELAPYMLGVSALDLSSLDVSMIMDFDYCGDHNEIVAEAILGSGPLTNLLEQGGFKPVDLQPGLVFALSDDCRMQGRISIESRTNTYEIRTGKYNDEKPISLNFMVRQYPQPNEKFDALRSFAGQWAMLNELMADKIVPIFVKPLVNAISQRRK